MLLSQFFYIYLNFAASSIDQYVVDFAPELSQIITEAKYLEQAGFSIPELARNVALQEDKYIRNVDGLKRMLAQYHACLKMLNDAEVCMIIISAVEISSWLYWLNI